MVKNPYNKKHQEDNQKGLPKKVRESNRQEAAARAQADKNQKKNPRNKS